MVDKYIKGELWWIKATEDRYDEYEGKKSWTVTVFPDKESLDIVRDMQADGIRNKVKKDAEKGWNVKFSRPFNKTNSAGKVTKVFEPPFIVDSNGNVVSGSINNGATGIVKVDFSEGKTSKGSYFTARLEGIKLIDFTLYGSTTPSAKAEEPKQENFF